MPLINGRNVSVFDSPEELAEAAAQKFIAEANSAIKARGRVAFALAGGQTPRRVYELLGTEFANSVEWQSVNLFFGDERCVPPGHVNSNYRMVQESLIAKVPIPAANVHRMMGEAGALEGAALYERELKNFFTGQVWPRFDLVFLGLGTDGHTASLFPGSSALNETEKWVSAAEAADHSDRITLTFPVINNAAHVVFIVTGKEKASSLRAVLGDADGDVSSLPPARHVKPANGLLEWLVDRNAAALLLASAMHVAQCPEDDDEN
ncbi:MAG TPA: 6-phosphogluconolactonase [Pyrinomonadaceae bacterium]|nr:6-phosphogluconolactonase [Pyrinomonadaceae bacterium]